jgi:hypothetical protein
LPQAGPAPGGHLALPSCGLEVHVQAKPDVSPGRNGLAARCFGCRNRFGFVNLIVLDSGVLCCRRCWRSCDILEAPGRKGDVDLVG